MAYSPSPAPTSQQPVKQGNGFGVTALVLGIFAILGFWLPLVNISSMVLGALAVVFAIVAFAVSGKRDGAGKATGATGLVLGILAVGASLGWNAVVFDAAEEEAQQECLDSGSSVEECQRQAEEVADLEHQVQELRDQIGELLDSEGDSERPEESEGESEQPQDAGETPEESEPVSEETTE